MPVAGTAILAVPSNDTPLIVLAVASLVASAAKVAVVALPARLPAIGAVTVKLARVPTEVSEELTIVDFKVVPVNVLASAAAVISILAVPSNATPLIVLAVASLVALVAKVALEALPARLPEIGLVTVNPVKVPTEVMFGCAAVVTVPAVVALEAEVALVAVAAFPVILPAIGLVTVKLASVPTEVSEEASTFDAKVAPVNVPASAAAERVILSVPSNATPLIVLAVASLVAVAELPVTLPAIGAVTVNPVNVPTEVTFG